MSAKIKKVEAAPDEVSLGMLCYLGWPEYLGSMAALARAINMKPNRLRYILSDWHKWGVWAKGSLTEEGIGWTDCLLRVSYLRDKLRSLTLITDRLKAGVIL